jgi:hypothetical protein
MRKFITIMESIGDESIVDHIAGMVRQGYHEGYGPYWKLVADPRLLEDEAAMLHISELIAAGFTSGHHPSWDLKVIEKAEDQPESPSITADGEDVGEVEDRMAKKHPEVVDEEIVDETPKAKHRVVPVHQKNGAGAGWWECPDEHAELFVVEDDAGEPVDGGTYHDRNSADAHCHHLNTDEAVTGDQMLDEIDVDPTDGADLDAHAAAAMADNLAAGGNSEPTMFADKADHEVEVAAVYERGHAQDEAFRELEARGIQLTDHQMSLSGR